MSSKWSDFFTLLQEASKHPNRSSFAKNKRNAYNAAKKAGLLDSFFPTTTWTMWATIKEAEKFRSRSAFRKVSPVAFATMERNGLMESFFARWQQEDKPVRDAAALMPTMRELEALEKTWK
jgi:hypothetical protein